MKEKSFHHPSEIIGKITESLSAGRSLVLATVISRSGSSPREAGAMMAILERGPVTGTVGGGILEAQVQGVAAEAIRNGQSVLCHFLLAGERAAEGEMKQDYWASVVLVHFMREGDRGISVKDLVRKYPYGESREKVATGWK